MAKKDGKEEVDSEGEELNGVKLLMAELIKKGEKIDCKCEKDVPVDEGEASTGTVDGGSEIVIGFGDDTAEIDGDSEMIFGEHDDNRPDTSVIDGGSVELFGGL